VLGTPQFGLTQPTCVPDLILSSSVITWEHREYGEPEALHGLHRSA